MFTGLVEEQGAVVALATLPDGGLRLSVRSTFTDLTSGESIAVDGVCLTLLPQQFADLLCFDLSPETQACTTLSSLQPENVVHLERALLMSSRLGGHLLSGHVDRTLTLKAKTWVGSSLELCFGDLSEAEQYYVYTKGSIALNGVSLTLNKVVSGEFTVMLIPHTLGKTKFWALEVGQIVNLEFDYLARAVAAQLQGLRKERLIC